jgi:hypothetical protein
MPRHLLVAGVDFGTSFTKVVLRDNNTPGQNAVAVTFPGYADGLLPSIVHLGRGSLLPPTMADEHTKVPYLKMLAAHVANGEALDATNVRIPAALNAMRGALPDSDLVRELLAFYFAQVMAGTEDFIRSKSPWRDFDFTPGNQNDYLIYQLAVPSGLLAGDGATERLFREAFIAAHELRRSIDATMESGVAQKLWTERVLEVFSGDRAELESRYEWQCLLYPEVAAAVQTVFRSPNARDGLYLTMDVGAGTVDLNAFRRFTGHPQQNGNGENAPGRLDYYSAIVCPLGVQNLNDPHRAVRRLDERELFENLKANLFRLYTRGQEYQSNLNLPPGDRPWDRATLFIFGGGSHHPGYKRTFTRGPNQGWLQVLDPAFADLPVRSPQRHRALRPPHVHNLPAAQDLTLPRNVEFGRFAVAYGISFANYNLDQVRLPHELRPFRELYPESEDEPPRQYGFNWDD